MTGSIGAIAVVPNYEELYEKLGIDMQIVSTGEFKDMLQPSREMTDDERDVLQEILDESFEEFLNVVADGRDMSLDEVRELADGRVFSGNQGQENGLVDDLGDRRDALDIAGELSGLGDDPPTQTYQQEVGFWDAFWGNSSDLVSSLTPFDAEIDPRSFNLEIRYELR